MVVRRRSAKIHAMKIAILMRATQLVMLGTLAVIGLCGCGASYRVLRSDPDVEIASTRWVILPAVAREGVQVELLEEGLTSGLAEGWPHHTFARAEAVEPGTHGLRVTVTSLGIESGHMTVASRIAIMDDQGSTPDEIETEVTVVSDAGESAAGRALASRVAEYLRMREQHHH